MAAPAAAASSSSSSSYAPYLVFRIVGGATPTLVGNLSPPFPVASTRWLDIVDSHLEHFPKDRECMWSIQRAGQDKERRVLGIDIPLTDMLAQLGERTMGAVVVLTLLAQPPPITDDTLGMLAERTYANASRETTELMRQTHIETNTSESVIEYEKIKYARACAKAGLAWPLWDATDEDPINGEVLGSWTAQREQRRSIRPQPRESDNNIQNLVLLRHGKHMRACNVYSLRRFLQGTMVPPPENPYKFANGYEQFNIREPVFNSHVKDPRELIEAIGTAVLTVVRTSADRDHVSSLYLPIVNLQNLVDFTDRSYGRAFAAESSSAHKLLVAPIPPAQRRKLDTDVLLTTTLKRVREVGTTEDEEDELGGGWGEAPSLDELLEIVREEKDAVDADHIEAVAKVEHEAVTTLSLSEQLRRAFEADPDGTPADWLDTLGKARLQTAEWAEKIEFDALRAAVRAVDYEYRVNSAKRQRIAPSGPYAAALVAAGEEPEWEAFDAFRRRANAHAERRRAAMSAVMAPVAAANKLACRMRNNGVRTMP